MHVAFNPEPPAMIIANSCGLQGRENDMQHGHCGPSTSRDVLGDEKDRSIRRDPPIQNMTRVGSFVINESWADC